MAESVNQGQPMIHPKNDVIAVIDDRSRADEAIRALQEAGFGPGDIHVFRGRDQMRALRDSWWAHSGIPSWIAPLLAELLSDESEFEKTYEREGLEGHTVLGVHTRDDDDIERARRVLIQHQAHDVHFFGRLTIADLSPGRSSTGG